VKITDFGISSLAPDGTRISAMDRAAMVASSSSLPDPQEALDPFAASSGGGVERRACRGGRRGSRRCGSRSSKRAEAGEGAARLGAGDERAPELLLDLEYKPATASNTSPEGETVELPKLVVEGPAAAAPRTPATPATPSTPLTETGLIFGTPQYMAQELTTGTKNATRSSTCSAGHHRVRGDDGKASVPGSPGEREAERPSAPRTVPFRVMCPTLPQAVATLLDRSMSHDPRTRPARRSWRSR